MNKTNWIAILVLAMSSLLQAAITPISVGGGGGERKLTGHGGILDKLYGWDNVTRIEDSGSVVTDQYWSIAPDASTSSSKIVSKNAGFNLNFGFYEEIAGQLVFNSDITRINPCSTVRLALDILSKPGFTWSSATDDNKIMSNGYVFDDSSVIDHMVTWQITSSDKHHNNPVGNFVVAWEDLDPSNLLGRFDGDYNDLVVEISGLQPGLGPSAAIPEPQTLALLLFSGLMLLKKRSDSRTTTEP